MKCPKCGYLGFETTDRCRNCQYDFSLAPLRAETDLALNDRAATFVHDIGRSREADAIVTAVIDLGRRLGLTVIAEGIEDLAQAALVQRLGCAIGQGYALGAPQPADAIVALLTGEAEDRAA